MSFFGLSLSKRVRDKGRLILQGQEDASLLSERLAHGWRLSDFEHEASTRGSQDEDLEGHALRRRFEGEKRAGMVGKLLR
jgi:hypothetical protein